MCPQITCSAIAKYPFFFFFFFFDALKIGQNEKSYIFQEIGIPEIHVQLFEIFQNLNSTSSLMLCLHKKTLSAWKMELSLAKVAQIVLGVKYAKSYKIKRVNHISCGGYLNTMSKG